MSKHYSVLDRQQAIVGQQVDRFISLKQARKVTRDFTLKTDGIISHLYEGVKVSRLLDQEEAYGFRVYHGKHIDGLLKGMHAIVLVSVDKFNNDLTNGLILELSSGCPPYCMDMFSNKDDDLNKNLWMQSGSFISLELAGQLTDDFTYNIAGNVAYLFSAEKVRQILEQPGCNGLRFYHGESPAGDHTLIAIGANRFGKDLRLGKMLTSELVNTL